MIRKALVRSSILARTAIYPVIAMIVLASTACIQITAPIQPPSQAGTPPTSISAGQAVQPDTTINIGSVTYSTIRPLLGVNAGPVRAGTDTTNADLTAVYKQYGVNLVRTHDYYGPLDMSVMYPDRTRDPSNPQSYNFTASDQVWKAIVSNGFEPYFRLGDSWNNAAPPVNALERSNWVKAGMEVLRHYRQGKWAGFNNDFRYVEVWNEPDNQQFWPRPRTPLEYFQLYCETSSAIKQQFPELKVGGPGLTPAGALAPLGRKWTQDFLDYIKQKNAPLDFFSWHLYSSAPAQYTEAANFYRGALDARGFTRAGSHITEWNTDIKQGSDRGAEAIALRTGGRGATVLTAAWIGLQDSNVEVSTFYRGTDTSSNLETFYGMFYADGRPKHIALAFSLWSKIVAYPRRMATSVSADATLRLLAGQDAAGKVALLIANTGDQPVKTAIAFTGGRQVKNISFYQVGDVTSQVQTGSLTSPVTEINPNTVQLLIFD